MVIYAPAAMHSHSGYHSVVFAYSIVQLGTATVQIHIDTYSTARCNQILACFVISHAIWGSSDEMADTATQARTQGSLLA